MANVIELIIRATDEATKPLENVADKISGSFDKVGKNMIKAGAGLGLAVAPAVAAFADATQQAAAFDESMTNVGAVLGRSKSEMQELNAEVLAIGAASRAGPQAASEAFYDIVGGVADASTHMAILEAAIATAEAGSADLGGTTSALISTMNAYNFAADKASFASDVLTQTVGMGVGSMEEFARAMPQVTSLASSLDIGFEDVGASMAFLTTRGFSASQSATQLRASMVSLMNPNAAMQKSLEEIGFASGAAAIEQLGLAGTYDLLASESSTFNDNMAGSVGSVEALQAVLAMTDDEFSDFVDSFKETAEGATDAARDIQLDSFAAQMDVLNSSADALRIQIGLALLPTITRLVRGAQPVIQSIIAWVGANQPLIATIAKVVAGIAGFAAVLTGLGSVLTIAGTLIGALLSPLGLILGAVTLLGFAIRENFLGIGDVFRDLVNGIQQFASEITSAFEAGGFEAVGQLILDKIKSGLSAVTQWAMDNIVTPIKNAFDTGGLEGVANLVLDFLKPSFTTVSTWVTTNIVTPLADAIGAINWSTVPGKLEAIMTAIFAMETTVFNFVVDEIFNPISRNIRLMPWDTIRGRLDDILQAIFTGAKSVGQWLIDEIWTPLQTGLGDSTQVQNISTKAGELAASLITGLADGIGDMAQWVKTNIIDKIISSLTGGEGGGEGVQSGGSSLAKNILTGIATAFVNMVTWTWNNVLWPFVSGLTGEANLGMLLDNVLVLGESILDGIIQGLGDLAGFVLNDIIIPLGSELFIQAGIALGYALEIGDAIVDGIKQGINDGWESFTNWFEGKINGLVDGALGWLGIKSPSRVFAAMGQDVVAGFAQGINRNLDMASAAVGNMAQSSIGGIPIRGAAAIPRGGGGGGAMAGGSITIGTVIIQDSGDPAKTWNELEREARRRNRTFAPRAGAMRS